MNNFRFTPENFDELAGTIVDNRHSYFAALQANKILDKHIATLTRVYALSSTTEVWSERQLPADNKVAFLFDVGEIVTPTNVNAGGEK